MRLVFNRSGIATGGLIHSLDFGRSELVINNASLIDDGVPTLNLEFLTPDDRSVIARAVHPDPRGSDVIVVLEAEINDALSCDNLSLYRINAGGTQFNAQVRGKLRSLKSRGAASTAATRLPAQDCGEGTTRDLKTHEEIIQKSSSKITPPQVHGKRKSLLAWFILAAVLVMLGSVVWWFFMRSNSELDQPSAPLDQNQEQVAQLQEAEDNSASMQSEPTTVVEPCALISSQQDSELLKTCMASKPDPKRLLALADEAQRAGRCEIAVRIYSSLGRTGDGEAAYIYAGLFNPISDASSSCVVKDHKQAVYWYEKARDLGDQELKEKALKDLEGLQANK